MLKTKKIKNFNDGSLVTHDNVFYFEDVDGRSKGFLTKKEAVDAYYIKQAYDYLGSSIRDNSIKEKIFIGKQIDKGIWDKNL